MAMEGEQDFYCQFRVRKRSYKIFVVKIIHGAVMICAVRKQSLHTQSCCLPLPHKEALVTAQALRAAPSLWASKKLLSHEQHRLR